MELTHTIWPQPIFRDVKPGEKKKKKNKERKKLTNKRPETSRTLPYMENNICL